ncbi:MAG: AAA family ATPase, partial [candidate division KSB1 bacterium]|nr:AAA family ATPase [candidate division KSB1 bacterium]
MISILEIKNFKSIKHITLDCRKVNIFIGKPNTGKSNILESVSIFS